MGGDNALKKSSRVSLQQRKCQLSSFNYATETKQKVNACLEESLQIFAYSEKNQLDEPVKAIRSKEYASMVVAIRL